MRRLRLQLIGLLVLAVLLPSIPAAWIAHSLFRRSLDPLLDSRLLEGVKAGLAMTRDDLEKEKERFLQTVAEGLPLDTLTVGELDALDPRERSALTSLAKAEGHQEGNRPGAQVLIPPERLPLGRRDLLIASIRGEGGRPVWITRELPPELIERAGELSETLQLLQMLRRERGAVIRSLVASFLLAYGLILALVLVLGLGISSRLTRPLAALGAGIQRVASGDLEARVPESSGGEIGRLLRNFNEMTARLKDQQAELVRLEKLAAWRQMARRLAHEIKNPLTPIQLAAQEFREAYRGSDPEYKRLLEEGTAIIEEEIRGLRSLVSEFSQFARLPDPQMSPIDLRELLTDVAVLYGDRVRFSLDPPEGAPPVDCDRDQIHRVLINLVDNALAAQGEAGRSEPVEIRARAAGGDSTLRIEVADRGPGVPASQRQRIFEPDVSTKSHGMGLGLSIAENTAQLHGGSIEVGDREGGGALFTLILPRDPARGRGEH